MTVEQDKRLHAFVGYTKFAQVGHPAERSLAASPQNALHSFGADAGDAQKLLPFGPVELDRVVTQVVVGPGLFGVFVQRKVASLVKGELFQVIAVIPEEVGGLVEPVLAQRVFGRLVFQGRVFDRLEGGVVDPLQFELFEQPFAGREELQVALPRPADDKLGRG